MHLARRKARVAALSAVLGGALLLAGLAACSSGDDDDNGVEGADAASDAHADGSSSLDATRPDASPGPEADGSTPPGLDATVPDGGALDASPDANGDATLADAAGDGAVDAAAHDGGGDAAGDAAAPCDLASAAIAPPVFAGIDFQTTTSIAQITTNCPKSTTIDPVNGDSVTYGDNAVTIQYSDDGGTPSLVYLNAGYTGTMSLTSRANGAYGTHTYSIGVGTLTRDGAAFVIDLSNGATSAMPAVEELYDAYLATLYPYLQSATGYCAQYACLVVPDTNGQGLVGFRGEWPDDFYMYLDLTSGKPTGFYAGVKTRVNPADGAADAGTALCDPTTRWPAMVQEPIAPPYMAGVNYATSTTLAQLEAVNCAGTPDGDGTIGWGANDEVTVQYDTNNRVQEIMLSSGYTGTMRLTSRSGSAFGAHGYVIGVGTLTRDGAAFPLFTTANGASTAIGSAVSELYDAYLATFYPELPAVTFDCTTTSTCLAVDANPSFAVGFRAPWPFDFYMYLDETSGVPSFLYVEVSAQ